MKKIPIKFRADSCIGKICGWYVEREGKPYIINDVGAMVSIDKESVKQLVSYDANGEEIYEGDVLFDANGEVVKAQLNSVFFYRDWFEDCKGDIYLKKGNSK